MFGLGGDDVVFFVMVKVYEIFDGDVVGFGGVGGEDDFFRGCVDEMCYLGMGGFDGGFGFLVVEVGMVVGVVELGKVVG